ncbi:MAG: hypothetical protein LBT68_04040 [Spirochaetales bacterium]|jgi:hypothetical protein|nr:hypothetical protein [Spirochaetales bacterium]
MKNKVNTLFFVVTATVVNVILMSVLFLFAYSVYRIIAGRHFSPGINTAVIFLLFIGSVALTYVIHKTLVKFLVKRPGVGKFFYIPPQKEKNGREEGL